MVSYEFKYLEIEMYVFQKNPANPTCYAFIAGEFKSPYRLSETPFIIHRNLL